MAGLSDIASGVSQLNKDIGAVKQAVATNTAEAQKTETSAFAQFKSASSDIAAGYAKLKAEGENLKPFEAPTPKDPLKSYGASMAGLLGIVSAFTRAPMVDAMNAAAASINAIKANNTAEYDTAFNTWKANSDFAFKKLSWENEQLQSAINLATTDYNAAEAHIRSLAAITQDKALLVTLDGQGIEAAAKLYDARVKGAESAMKQAEFMATTGQRIKIWNDWQKTNPNASAQEKLVANNLIMSGGDLSLLSPGGGGESGGVGPAGGQGTESLGPSRVNLGVAGRLGYDFGKITSGVSQFFGGGKAPEGLSRDVLETEKALDTLKVHTLSALKSEIPGRESKAMVERFQEDMAVESGMFTVPQSAWIKMRNTNSFLMSEANRIRKDILTQPGNYTQAQVGAARANYSELLSLSHQYSQVLDDNAAYDPDLPAARDLPNGQTWLGVNNKPVLVVKDGRWLTPKQAGFQ